ncbi:GMC family oxidoreductase [Aspergillus mulundensis]|uniref:Glucose-methanol-choline oxidoreductase N-terminal domain-containing protein n=1 Tax=Aspergillus mulundensis TaxID=1810919 RepID=A0A3D8SKT2_9EURO|nr:Uncharacterized protein DSM5745_03579 [Aspergillus mulundensis]RDW86937.1 Uncharacterized protein DSM5745_03579 [Aspergillus mulundensis]
MSSNNQTWDFIIVGSGPSGSALASKLSLSASQPRILLLEAGPRKDDRTLRVSGNRWTTFQEPSINWGYKTTPQEHCNGREIDYSRGKVVGGGSAINFGIYTVGAKDDYDAWAEIVGDENFNWERMQARFRDIEAFDTRIPNEAYRAFAAPDPQQHGDSGALKLSYAEEWEEDLPLVMEAFRQAGVKWNMDHNSGDPIGVGMAINSVYKGVRSTAGDVLDDALAKGRGNLEVKTGKTVRRVVFEGERAVGVEAGDEIFYASKEVILSAGSLDTPRILMHSGIGPAAHLSEFNIPILKDVPCIGQGLRDHPFVPVCFLRNPSTNNRNAFYGSQSAMDAAMKQWLVDGSGPWAQRGAQLIMGWLKSETVSCSPEFAALPADVQAFLNKPTVPHYEISAGFPLHMLAPGLTSDYSYVCLLAFLMNEQSVGEVRLQSSDPEVPLLFNANFLAHPFDRRVCVESVRELLALTKHEAFAKDTVSMILGPASESDEDILEHWRSTIASSWHMTGTVKMGREGDKDAAVDGSFRVMGLQGLRVADMSVVPVLANNHTQATAYVTGATAADVLIQEYGLDAVASRL